MTEPDKTGLSIEQENALLILGKTDAEVAAAVGVTRKPSTGGATTTRSS